MQERQIEPLDFNGETIFIEVAEVEGGQLSDDGCEHTSTEAELIKTGERVRSTISTLADVVRSGLDRVDPTEWTLEINLGFKGKAGIPFITEGEANGAIKVTAKWLKR